MTLSMQQLIARQIRLWEALKTDQPAGHEEPVPRPAITISRQAGIDAAPLARRLARQTGYSVWDQEIIDYVARSSGTRRQFLEALEEHQQTAVERWVEGALHGHLFDTGDYTRALVHVIRALGEQGNAIIIGRGAHFVIQPERAVRIRLVAPIDFRAEAARELDESAAAAQKRLAKEDRTREEFMASVLKSDPHDPSSYDLMINVERLSESSQCRLILELLHARAPHAVA